MARMSTNAPARKVVASSLSVAISTVAIWALEEGLQIAVPEYVRSAILTIVVFLAGYFTPPSDADTIVLRESGREPRS